MGIWKGGFQGSNMQALPRNALFTKVKCVRSSSGENKMTECRFFVFFQPLIQRQVTIQHVPVPLTASSRAAIYI